ncbi:hypothetical protein [Micromonospora sp. DT47]|uniref:hypothetical protein n=1 Tax=Micromonospora sp. DT47 TaxID=3393431 RepID=UPI003CF298A1
MTWAFSQLPLTLLLAMAQAYPALAAAIPPTIAEQVAEELAARPATSATIVAQ